VPILIQRQGDDFRGPHDVYAFPSEDDNGDFEGEFAVVLDGVRMGVSATDALDHVKLVTIFNGNPPAKRARLEVEFST
jgi:fumarylacetoacetate (FAA) hydrolase